MCNFPIQPKRCDIGAQLEVDVFCVFGGMVDAVARGAINWLPVEPVDLPGANVAKNGPVSIVRGFAVTVHGGDQIEVLRRDRMRWTNRRPRDRNDELSGSHRACARYAMCRWSALVVSRASPHGCRIAVSPRPPINDCVLAYHEDVHHRVRLQRVLTATHRAASVVRNDGDDGLYEASRLKETYC